MKLKTLALQAAMFLGLMVAAANVWAHTTEVSYEVEDGVATIYMGTYHSEQFFFVSGQGIILNGVTYQFVNYPSEIIPAASFTPDPAKSSKCPGNTPAHQKWYKITIADLTDGVYTVNPTSRTAAEAPWPGCVYPNLVIEGVNAPPVADAGPDQSVNEGAVVFLDGSASSDDDGDALTYSWSMVSKPVGSVAVIFPVDAVLSSFNADEPGNYVVSLTVNDGSEDSDPATITVTAVRTAEIDLKKAKVKLGKHAGKDKFEVKGRFVLLAASDGVDPLTEDVNVTFDGLSVTLLAGSFVSDDDQCSKYKGGEAGITKVKICDDGRFKVKGKKLDLSGIDFANPVRFSLKIGNDLGKTEIPFTADGKREFEFEKDDDDDDDDDDDKDDDDKHRKKKNRNHKDD